MIGQGIRRLSDRFTPLLRSLAYLTFSTGAILYASGANTLSALAAGTALQNLRMNSAGTAPEWAAAREVLTANRTYYVATSGGSGSDSNTGLTALTPFLTIQKAIDVILGTLDLGGFNVTVQIADGTYTGAVNFNGAQIGKGLITIQGNSGTPANVVVSTTSASCFTGSAMGSKAHIKDLKMQTTTSGYCIEANAGSHLLYSNVNFGAVPSGYSHVTAAAGALIEASGNYAISGGANCHWDVNNGAIFCGGRTITITGTPAFSVAFARVNSIGYLQAWSNTYSGSATGSRYTIAGNSILQTFGAATTALPGNAIGTEATGGRYL